MPSSTSSPNQSTPATTPRGRNSRLTPYTEEWSWGRIEFPDPVQMARSGMARYRLSVYAPGTSELERKDLVLAKRWWFASALTTILAELGIAATRASFSAAVIVSLAGLAVSWFWLARTRHIRQNTRSLRVVVVMIGSPSHVLGNAALFGECRRKLAHVGEQSTANPVEREKIWADVYESLSPAQPRYWS